MNTSKTNEQAFEALIEKALVGSSCEERDFSDDNEKKIAADEQSPNDDQYYWGIPSDMDKTLSIDKRRFWSFLNSSQADTLAEYRGRNLTSDVEKQVSRAIDTYGIIDVLRKGVDVENIHLTMFYSKPSAADSEDSHINYAKNQFSVTRQQTFSNSHPGLELDMAVFVNGLPIFTLELKNPWTRQTALYDGIKQYCSPQRNPAETILKFGRCLAHFTLDKDEVYFTTHLNLSNTYFMPFNKGLENGQGAGNPVNPNGYKTSYMWEFVLKKDTVADIISNYALFDYGEIKSQKKVPHIMRNAKALIFPRFHQLDVVNKLTADVSLKGVGEKYLIQHSAGSGKSNSITWLAYKLIKECPVTLSANKAKALDAPLFNSVVVVTDRRILDKQISDNIKAFGHSEKIIAHANSSAELKEAIESNKRIIVTTIQKFPYISSTIGDVSDHNFAILIDEAHSSQSGIAADKMNATMQKDEDLDGPDTDDMLEKLMNERKMSPNCSYFAFTATPKPHTFERFGIRNEDGTFSPFHLYSMKQAIEEGFILDVLVNYTTYKSYYELVKTIEENPLYDTKKAQKLLKKAVERTPQTIKAKAEQMLAHFDANLYKKNKLCGKAKAMVVTKDIECAIKYYQALLDLKEENNLPYGILIAFSGARTIDGVEYTESKINGFSDKRLPEEFDKDDNRILVVANKYLTGFDQPKLAAMYIDKPLAGVMAVQSLSRLNRSSASLKKMSEDLFILDFYNKISDIKDAFDPFYTTTSLSEPSDVNVLHLLRRTLLDTSVFNEEDIDDFTVRFLTEKDSSKWAPIIDGCAHRFNVEVQWGKDGKADFKIKCKQFVKIYSKVAAILDYNIRDWEKLFWFLRFLIPQLHIEDSGMKDVSDILDKVNLNTYGLRRTNLNENIKLESEGSVLDPNNDTMAGAGGEEPEPDPLETIIKAFNKNHFKGWEATPEDQKAKLINIATSIIADEDYKEYVAGNPDPQTKEEALNNIIDKVIRQKRQGDVTLYRQYQQNEDFKMQFRNILVRMIDSICALKGQTALSGIKLTGTTPISIPVAEQAPALYGNVRCVNPKPNMKNVALAVKQPWATLICTGIKDVENRTWKTDYRGRLYIVASSTDQLSVFENQEVPQEWLDIITEQQAKGNLPDLKDCPKSAVIGYVDVVDCSCDYVDSVWSGGSIDNGNVNWILKNAHVFKNAQFPGFKAKLNFFEIPELDEDNLPPTMEITL
ncbi:MAG: DEAD/DEAH box helicase family protein [Paludibacteraceae bacterium]|nr:DEAD/DEAH box helicase family protein [Paludibacteraceae bacterium]